MSTVYVFFIIGFFSLSFHLVLFFLELFFFFLFCSYSVGTVYFSLIWQNCIFLMIICFFLLIWHILLELLTCKNERNIFFHLEEYVFFSITWNCIFFISSGFAHPLYVLLFFGWPLSSDGMRGSTI